MARGLGVAIAVAGALLLETSAPALAATLNFANKCAFQIELVHIAAGVSGNATLIDVGTQLSKTNVTGANYVRHTSNLEATLVSITYDLKKGALYDVSIVPPQAGYCSSFAECRNTSHGLRGYNVPVRVEPKDAASTDLCRTLYCGGDDPELCMDAFLFPTDSTKKRHRCALATDFDIVFCPDEGTAIRAVVSDDLNLRNDTIQFPVAASLSPDRTAGLEIDFGSVTTVADDTRAEVQAFDSKESEALTPSVTPAATNLVIGFSTSDIESKVQAAVHPFSSAPPSDLPESTATFSATPYPGTTFGSVTDVSTAASVTVPDIA